MFRLKCDTLARPSRTVGLRPAEASATVTTWPILENLRGRASVTEEPDTAAMVWCSGTPPASDELTCWNK